MENNQNNALNTTPVADPMNLSYVSPFVTISRGNRLSARKEKEAREAKYTLESRKSLDLNESVEDRQYKEAAKYFRLQVQKEIDRFKELIDQWRKYKEEHNNDSVIPSEYQDLIDVTIGQCNLLITSKFKQFSKLIDQCENKSGVQPVKPEDLEGFWTMVYIQVDNCSARFQRLDSLKDNNWEDPELNVRKEKKIRNNDTTIAKKKPRNDRANSALAKMMQEARKKYKETQANGSQPAQNEDCFVMVKRKSLVPNDSGKRRHSTPRPSITPRRTLTPRRSEWKAS